MSSSSFLTASSPKVKANKAKTVLTFLSKPNTNVTEAWILARAGSNNNGALEVRLVDQFGVHLSGTVEVFGQTQLEKIKFLNVNIPATQFPTVVRVEAKNTSSTGNKAIVEGVLLVVN